ncbi:putative tetratricopeptide-like helical domain superfamily [Plasmopara halstedii]
MTKPDFLMNRSMMTSVIHRQRNIFTVKTDGLKAEIRVRRKKAMDYMLWLRIVCARVGQERLVGRFYICKAHRYLKEKEFNGAIEVLKAFEKKDPAHRAMAGQTSVIFILLKVTRHKQTNTHQWRCDISATMLKLCKELFLEAIGVEADCVEAIYNLGLVNIKMGVINEGLQAFENFTALFRQILKFFTRSRAFTTP